MGETHAKKDRVGPFEGRAPAPIHCEWRSTRDEEIAPDADIIRLVVDDRRGDCGACENITYQRHFLRDIQQFVGPTRAVLATDAGALKTYIPSIAPDIGYLESETISIGLSLSPLLGWKGDVLLGVDGCTRGGATHLQSVLHLSKHRLVSLTNSTIKLYPAGDERGSLVGWQICDGCDEVPDELADSRRVRTSVGDILVLVCNDAALFAARSLANLESKAGLMIRKHFIERAVAKPQLPYILIATHWQGINPKTHRWSGEAFRQAARYLNEQTGATVVTTLRTQPHQLHSAADRFPTIGLRRDRVATLLVRDSA